MDHTSLWFLVAHDHHAVKIIAQTYSQSLTIELISNSKSNMSIKACQQPLSTKLKLPVFNHFIQTSVQKPLPFK